VGATGIVMMQGISNRGNQQAQETTVAVNIAQTWIDRIKRDALRWTARGSATRIANTTNLNQDPLPGADAPGAGPGNWIVPNAALPRPLDPAAGSWAFDAFGFDIADPIGNTQAIRYCVNINPVLLSTAPNPTPATPGDDTIRVDVRVWWSRAGGALQPTMLAGCGAVPPAAEINSTAVRSVIFSTVVTWEDPAT
jgi:hypothetical protein